MEWGWMHAVLGITIVVALGLFLKACVGGSRLLGGFWDRERQRQVEVVAAARTERAQQRSPER